MLIVAVKNTSGSTISAGQVVYQTDYLRPQQLPIVALASAAAISTAEVLGICVWDIADNETGPIAVSGDVYPIDTSIFSAINDKVYLSDTPGAISATSGTVPAVIGTVKVVGAAGTINTTGTINIPTFSVTAITPSSGPTAGSTAVTITGAGFVSVTDVTIGGTSCTSIVTVDVNTITAVTPAGSAGAQDVVVTTSAGSKTLTGGFTYVAVPTVTSITPTSGVTTGGTAVTIAGTNFFSAPGVPGASAVTIGGVTCTSIVYVSAVSITAVSPAGTAGAQDVVVTTPYGTGTLAGGFTYVAAPTVTSITPNSGDYLGGTAVTIAGTDFLASPGVPGALAVTIGGTTCTTIVYVSSISITAVSPAGSAGAQDVVVTTNYGTGTLAGGFTYTTFSNTYSMLFDGVDDYCESASSATTTSRQPYSISLWTKAGAYNFWEGLVTTGTTGYGATNSAWVVRIFGNRLYVIGPWGYMYGGSLSTTEWQHIVFTYEGTAGAGTDARATYVDGSLTSSGSGTTSQLNGVWNVGREADATDYSASYIDEVSFFRGVALSLAEVQEIYNAGLPTDLTTHSKYTDLRSWWRMGDKMVGATLPDQGPASNDLTAYNSPTLSTDIPTNEPSITSITPANGVPGGGTAVTIAGSKFVDAGGAPGFVSVTIGGVTCTSIVAVSTSSITAVTPAGTLGPEDLVVVTVNGTATLSDGFLYTNYSFDGLIATSTAWPDLDPASPAYSISFWIKVNTYGSYDDLISLYCAGGTSYRLLVRVVNESIVFYEGNADNAAHSNSTLNVYGALSNNLSVWHHYVVASPGDGGTLRVYVDGQLQGYGNGKALSAAPSNTYLQIAHGSSPSYYAVTDTDEVSMFNIELNAAQALALFNDGAPADITSHTGLTHWWRMGDTIGDTNTNLIDSVDAWNLDTVIGATALIADVPFVRVTSMSPYYGLDTGSTAIAIVGSNFVNVTSVTIGGVACTSVVTVDANNITAVTPAGSAGAEDLIVTTTGGSFTLPDAFVYVAALPPVIGFANTYASFTDGIDDYWEGGTASGINSSGSYSVSIWVYLVQPSGYTSIIRTGRVTGWSSSYYKRYYLEYGFGGATEIKLTTYESDGNNTGTGTGSTISFVPRSLILDQWSHFVMTSTGNGSANGCKLYRNGVLIDTFTGVALSGSATPMVTQVAWNSQSSYSKQYSDEFCIWEGAVLSASDVTDLYNAGVPIDSSTIENGSITHFWRMGDLTDTSGASGVIYDRVGSADLAAGGAPRASTGVAAWTNANSIDFAGSKLTTRGVPWPDSDMDPASPAYSVSIWIQVDTIGSYDVHFMLGNVSSFRMFMNFVTPRLYITEGDAGFETSSSTLAINGYGCLVDNLYHHYVITSPGDGGTVKLYIDGGLRDWGAGEALSATPARNMMWVWLTSYNNPYMAPDTDDEIAIFGAELSPVQVTNLYNNGIPTDISSHAGIQHYWRMGDGVGDVVGVATVIRDQVGYMDLNNNSNVFSTGTNIASTEVPYVYINDIDPYYGLTTGSTAITITGSNFVIVAAGEPAAGSPPSGVTIGGVECTNVVTVDSNTLTAVTPAGSAGAQDLIVTAIGGSQTAVGGFVYTASIPSWSNNYSMNFTSGALFTSKGWPELSTTNLGYSISFWMKVNTITTYDYYLALGSAKSYRFSLGHVTGGNMSFTEGNADDTAPATTSKTVSGLLTDTDWHHYVFTSEGNGGTSIIYHDGISVGTFTGEALGSTPTPHMWLLAGSSSLNGSNPVNFDEVALFGTELSSVQVTALYNLGTPTDITAHADIQHYYRMGDALGDTASLIRDQVGYWDLNTTYGTPALDADTPVWTDFRSMYFDGVDDSISTSGAWPELSASGSGYSVSLWIRLPNGTSGFPTYNYPFMLSDTTGGSTFRMQCFFFYNEGQLRLYEGNADTVSFSSSYVGVNRIVVDTLWHHYTITSTGTGSTNGVKIYIDGILKGYFTGKALGSSLASNRLFLASTSGGTSPLDANIDEFAIFDTELSSTDVVALYNNGAPTDLSAHADIQHWWRMGDELDTASVIYDQEGSWDLDTPLNDPVLQADTPLLIATQVEPYYGLSTGGTAITISGYNFDNVPTSNGVTIGGSSCTSIVVGSTTITAVTPIGSAGAEDLVITSGSSSLTLTDGFVYVPSIPAWANASSSGFDTTNALRSSESWPGLSASGSGYSVSFWARLPNGTSGFPTWNYVFQLGGDAGNPYGSFFRMGFVFLYNEGSYRFMEGSGDLLSLSSSYVASNRLVVDTLWHHFVLTSTGTGSANGLNIYLDGILKGSGTGKPLVTPVGAANLWIASSTNFSSRVDANIDEFAIFGAELSVGQVTAIYNGGVPTDITAHANIQNYYRMGDSIGDTAILIRDQVGGMDLDLPYGTPVLNADVPYLIATQVDPYYGDIAGSTTITITGSNLANVSAITVDGNPCTSISASASSVTADTPAGSAGAVDIVITDSTNTSEITLTNGFVYVTSIPAWDNASSSGFDTTNALRSSESWPGLSASGSGYSVSFWARLPNGTSGFPTWNYVFQLGDNSANAYGSTFRMGFTFLYNEGGYRFYEGSGESSDLGSGYVASNRLVVDTLWHHYAFTSTGTGSSGGLKIYLDGILMGSGTGKALVTPVETASLWIASSTNFSSRVDANIDEFAIFGAELSVGQVTAIYNGGVPTDITAHADIQHYYRMGDSIGDTAILIRDQVGGMDLDLPYGTPVLNADVPYLIATQVDPYYGDIAGSTTITITGSNLANVSAITVDGNPCTSISASASAVTADTPAGSAGAVDIVITDSTSTITLTNGFVYRTGSVPAWANTYSVEFDSTNALNSSEAWPGLSTSGSGYSVSFWAKADTSGFPTYSYVFNLGVSYGGAYGSIYRMYGRFFYNAGIFTVSESTGDNSLTSSSTNYSVLTDTDWHHYAITSTGTGSANGVKFYFDGALQGTGFTGKALITPVGTARLFLASAYNFGSRLDANIDEFAIFGAELSAVQVTALYNSGTPTDITAHANIQNYYRMGDSIGDTALLIRDQVGGLDLDLPYGTPVIDADVP